MMTTQTYYVSWHTWLEAEIQTPWDFWYVSKGTKPLQTQIQENIDLEQVSKIWQNKDVAAWQKLESAHVWDIKLAAFVEAASELDARTQVTQLFPDAVWDKCVVVDHVTKQQIIQLFGDTLKRSV